MKKIMSILIVIVMMLSISIMPVYAGAKSDAEQYKYFDKFFNTYFDYGDFEHDEVLGSYDELLYHYENESDEEPDWTLIICPVRCAAVMYKVGTVVGSRVLSIIGGGGPGFTDGYGVYIRDTDSFVELRQSSLEKIIELCPGFVEAIEENEIGQAFGDVNDDKVVDIFDATYVQRHIAGMMEDYNIEVNFSINIISDNNVSIGDFDRDGETTIMDATMIQRHLVGLE